MTTEEPHLVSVKILNTTRDLLQRNKKPLGVKRIEDVIQRYIEVAKQACFLLDFTDTEDICAEHPCDPCEEDNEERFNYRKCPSICPSYKNVKLTKWWSSVASEYGVLTKEGYIDLHSKWYRERKARHEAKIKRLDEEHRNDPNWKAGNWEYDYEHKPYEPQPTRQLLESRFKREVEAKKECVLRMEKLRQQPLFDEWKRIWNYPACIEGIKEIEEPEDKESE